MMLSHCVVSAIWQVASLPSVNVLFLEEWAMYMSDRWRRVPELPGLISYFHLHFNWFLPLDAFLQGGCYGTFKFITFPSPVYPNFTSCFLQESRARHCSHLCLLRERELCWAGLLLLLQLMGAAAAVCSQGGKQYLKWRLSEVCLP